MKISKTIYLMLSMAMMIIFIGCGEDDSDSNTIKIYHAPTAHAGKDQSVNINEVVTLKGTGKVGDGVSVSYEWQKDNKVVAETSLYTYVPKKVGKDIFTFVVTDNRGINNSDTVTITVNNISSENQAPKANAGEDKLVAEGKSITLIGKGTDSDGTIVSYEWKKGKEILATTASFNYTPESSFGDDETLTFTVIDNDGNSASDTMIISIIEFVIQPPTADAGEDQSVIVNTPVILIGKGTDSDGEIVEYRWEKAETVIARTAYLEYTPTEIGQDTLYLTVTDNDGGSDTDTVIININKAVVGNKAPIVSAGEDKSVIVNNSITLTGIAKDSDGSVSSYKWKKGNITLATTATFNYLPTTVGTDILTFIATDDKGANSSDTVTITVQKEKITNNDDTLKASTIPFLFTVEAKGTNEIAINVAGLSNKYKNQPNYNIEWGDGTADNGIKNSIKHTYPNSGNYNITLSGIYPRIFIPNLVSVEQWGNMQWTTMDNAFTNHKTTFNTSDTPDLSKVKDMSYMFAGSQFNGDLSSWDVSNVTNMSSMFYSSTFNQDISMWNTSKVKNMSSMFHFATKFNQNLSSWDVSNVTQMEDMFMNSSFNQNIGNWDVSNVENMSNMFNKNDNFNQDIGNWDVSNVKQMIAMFYEANNFNQNLSSWSLSKIEEMEDFMVNSGITTNNYDKSLMGWVKGNPRSFIAVDMGNVKYSKQAKSARLELINKYHWLIRDGGLAE